MKHLLPSSGHLPSVVLTGLTDEQKRQIAVLTGAERVTMLERKTLDNAEDIPLVIDLDSETPHIRSKALRQARTLDRKCGMVFVTSELIPQFKDVPTTSYLTLPLRTLDLHAYDAGAVRNKAAELLSRLCAPIRSFEQNLYKTRIRFENYTISTVSWLLTFANICMRICGLTANVSDPLTKTLERSLSRKINSSGIDAVDAILTACTSDRYALVAKKELTRVQAESGKAIAYDNERILIPSDTLSEIAADCGISNFSQFAEILDNEGLISHGRASGLQKAVRVGSGSPINFYDIPQDRIFPFGTVRLNSKEFTDENRHLLVPLAYCGDIPIYAAYDMNIQSENRHILVSGATASGKTTLIKSFAQKCAKANMAILAVGTVDSAVRFKGETLWNVAAKGLPKGLQKFRISELPALVSKVITLTKQDEEILSLFDSCEKLFTTISQAAVHILDDLGADIEVKSLCERLNEAADKIEEDARAASWKAYIRPGQITTVICDDDEKDQNAFLEDFFRYKSQYDHSPCLVIIDECHNFDMSRDSPLIKKLLRQGAKYGIALCLISQFFNSSELENITDVLSQFATMISFDRTDKGLKLIGVSAKDPYTADGISDWHEHDFLISGKIATDNRVINYPLICSLRDCET